MRAFEREHYVSRLNAEVEPARINRRNRNQSQAIQAHAE
jgi:hypothetical protein